MEDDQGRPSWTMRRRVVIGTLFYCAALIGYIVGFGNDNALHNTAIISAFTLSGGVIGSYVFGAIWTDLYMPRK